MRCLSRFVVLVALVLPVLACEQAPQPVARVGVQPVEVDLEYPGYDRLELTWDMREPLDSPQGEPMVFVHLIDDQGTVVRTFDHPLPFPWQAGTSRSYVISLYQSALAPPLDPASYRLTLGLYDLSGRRWALSEMGDEVAGLEYQVATVHTDGDHSTVPMFYFSPAWLPLEAGTDVQILGRRWLTGTGTLRVADIKEAGTVWMSLKISEAERDREELTLNEGATEPGVVVMSTCGGDVLEVAGFGSHEVQVPILEAAEAGLPAECEITLEPSFQITEVDTLTRRSVGLEVLAWSSD